MTVQCSILSRAFVARVESAAMDEEQMIHEVEMRVLPPHFSTKAQIRWPPAGGDRLAWSQA